MYSDKDAKRIMTHSLILITLTVAFFIWIVYTCITQSKLHAVECKEQYGSQATKGRYRDQCYLGNGEIRGLK